MLSPAQRMERICTREKKAKLTAWQRAELKYLQNQNEEKILDLQCGDGALLQALTAGSRRVLCGVCDTTEKARTVMECIREADVVSAPAGDIPWRAETFDTVCGGVLRRANAEAVTWEIVRVMKQGGKLVMLLPILRTQEEHMKAREAEQLMTEAGLAEVKIRRSGRYRVLTAVKP